MYQEPTTPDKYIEITNKTAPPSLGYELSMLAFTKTFFGYLCFRDFNYIFQFKSIEYILGYRVLINTKQITLFRLNIN